MGAIADQFDNAFRDFETDGVASSGPHDVVKSQVRAIGGMIETALANVGLGALVGVAYGSRAELEADLAHAADTVGLVYSDVTATNNDLYVKVGVSGAGSWTKTDALSDLVENLIGTGVVDAITVYSETDVAPVTGGYYSRTTGVLTVNAGYKTITYDVVGNEIGFKASGHLGGSGTCLAAYFDGPGAAGTFLGYQVLGDNATHTNIALVLPSGTQSIGISGQNAYPISLTIGAYADFGEVSERVQASFRAQTRTDLENAGTVPAAYGNVAEVFGHSTSGDSFARYIRGGGVYPTANGWGLDAQTMTSAMALGLSSTLDEEASSVYAVPEYKTPVYPKDAAILPEEYVALTGGGVYAPRVDKWRQLIWVDTAAGQIREIDCGHLPLNRPFRIAHRAEAHDGKVIMDAGFGSTWLDFGERFLVLPTGLRVTFERINSTQFIVTNASSVSANALSSLAEGEYSPIVRAASFVFAGQSLTDQGFGRGGSFGAFMERLDDVGGPASVYGIDAAYGGSGICERDVDPASPNNYWVDMTDPESPADGPNLTAAIAEITAMGGDLTQPAIAFILWDQGQQSSSFVDSPENPNANFTAAMYEDATAYAWSRLRTACGDASLPIGVQPIGRRTSVSSTALGRMQVIREAQLSLIAGDANSFALGETYDVALRDTVHPDDFGYMVAGRRAADAVAEFVYSVADLPQHPYVSSATVNTTRNSIDVVIRVNGATTPRILRVSSPWGFRVTDAGGDEMTIAAAHWTDVNSSNPGYFLATVRLYVDGDPTGGDLYVCWDYGPDFDVQRAIRTWTAQEAKPVRSGKISL